MSPGGCQPQAREPPSPAWPRCRGGPCSSEGSAGGAKHCPPLHRDMETMELWGVAAGCSPSSLLWLDTSTVCCLDLFLTLSSSPALSVSALMPHAPLHPRNQARLDLPSPSPTYPWSLLRPFLRSPARAASGRTPPPLPGSKAARQRGDRYRNLSRAAPQQRPRPLPPRDISWQGLGWGCPPSALAGGTGTAWRWHLAGGQQHVAGTCPLHGEQWAAFPYQPRRGPPVPARSPAPTCSTHCARSGQGLAPAVQPQSCCSPWRRPLCFPLPSPLSLSFCGTAPRCVVLASSADGDDLPNSCPFRANLDLGIPGNASAVLPLGEGPRFGHQETPVSLQPGGRDACTWGLAPQSSGRAELGRVTDPTASTSGTSSSRAAAG